VGLKSIFAFLRLGFVLLGLSMGTLASAGSTVGGASAIVLVPMTLLKLGDLNFGDVASSNATGTITLNPFGNVVTGTGGATPVGGSPVAAYFEFYGAAGQSFTITRSNPIILIRSGGTQTMNVTALYLDGATSQTLGATGVFKLHIGGQLAVGANQTNGTYIGTFTIFMTYP
jgi:hypothetical protein